jgi:hypothetical protein
LFASKPDAPYEFDPSDGRKSTLQSRLKPSILRDTFSVHIMTWEKVSHRVRTTPRVT